MGTNNKIKVPVVYLWNEVYGIGNHAAYIKYGNCGCYECFFDRDEETGELYDKTSILHEGTDYNGKCGRVWKDLRAIWKFGFTKNNVTLFKDGQKYF